MNAHMLLTGASEDNASGGNDLPIKVEDKTVEASGVAVSNGSDLSSSSAAAHPSTTTKKGKGGPQRRVARPKTPEHLPLNSSNLMMQLRKIR